MHLKPKFCFSGQQSFRAIGIGQRPYLETAPYPSLDALRRKDHRTVPTSNIGHSYKTEAQGKKMVPFLMNLYNLKR